MGLEGETGVNFLPVEKYLKMRSPSLIDNPQAKLNEKSEVKRHLDILAPSYLEELESMVSSAPPMSENCRLSIGIPAYRAGFNIVKMLELYGKQIDKNGIPIDPNLFEVIVFDNHSTGVAKDNTQEEVERFQKDHPGVKVIYVHKQWGLQEPATSANARRCLADLALLRTSQRKSHQVRDHILVFNDDDAEEMSDEYLHYIITAFDENPKIDALTGKNVLPDWAMQKPNLIAATRLWAIMSIIVEGGGVGDIRHKQPVGMVGRNMAMRASIYSAVGGFNPEGEGDSVDDLEMSWLIADARDWDPQSVVFLNKAKIITDPRRHLLALANRNPVFHMYLPKTFFDSLEVGDIDKDELLKKIPDDLDLDLLEKEVNAWWQGREAAEYQYLGPQFEPIFRRAMSFLGVDYEVVDDHVRVTNVKRLLEGLKKRLGKEVIVLPQRQGLKEIEQLGRYDSGKTKEMLLHNKAQELAARIKAVEEGKELKKGDRERLEFLKERYGAFKHLLTGYIN